MDTPSSCKTVVGSLRADGTSGDFGSTSFVARLDARSISARAFGHSKSCVILRIALVARPLCNLLDHLFGIVAASEGAFGGSPVVFRLGLCSLCQTLYLKSNTAVVSPARSYLLRASRARRFCCRSETWANPDRHGAAAFSSSRLLMRTEFCGRPMRIGESRSAEMG